MLDNFRRWVAARIRPASADRLDRAVANGDKTLRRARDVIEHFHDVEERIAARKPRAS